MEHEDLTLRYIEAENVEVPTGRLNGTVLLGPNDETVGTLDGLIIDPIRRRVHYFVVRSGNWFKAHRRLVPATPAKLNSADRTLHVNVNPDDLPRLPEVRPDTFERYSDDDLLAAMFSAPAA